MPTVQMRMTHRPMFEFEVSEEKLDEMNEKDLKRQLTTEADMELAEGAPYYDDDDWEMSVEEDS